MPKNATIAEQPTATLSGEATNGEQAVELPKEKQLTPQEQMDALLKDHPELAASFLKKEEPKIEPKIEIPPVINVKPKPVEKESRIFILAGDHFKRKGDVIIDMTDDVIMTDPVTGQKKTRRMRLIRGAQSIWQDEQGALPKEHIAKNQVMLTFSRGRCIIPIHETFKIQAALISNRNTDNENRVGHKDIYFYEWNPEKLNEVEEKRQNQIIEAMQVAATAKFEDLVEHAQYLGVPLNDEMGIPLSQSSVRTAYSKKAMSEPEKFLKSIHTPVVKTGHLIRKAVNDGLIDLGRQANQAFWTDGGFITALPQGRDSVEYLIEFAMVQGEANERFVSQLNNLLK